MGEHVILPSEVLPADGTGEHLDVDLVRSHVVPAEVADVRVDPITNRAPVQIFLAHAEVPRRLVRIADLLRGVHEFLFDIVGLVQVDVVEVVQIEHLCSFLFPRRRGCADRVQHVFRIELYFQRVVIRVDFLYVVVVLLDVDVRSGRRVLVTHRVIVGRYRCRFDF